MKLLIALVASMTIGAQASPIVFTSTGYDTTAFAAVGAAADAHSDASPTSPLPILSTATVVGANDFATSAAFGSSGLLFTQAEADSFPGAVGANAGAQSHFVGSILGDGALNLHLGFDNLNSILGGGTGDGTLFVLLTNTLGAVTTTLFNDVITSGGPVDLQYNVPVGGISKLDLLLFSEATTTAAGQSAQNFAQVTFGGTIGGTIPLPATPLLIIAAMGAMLAGRRKRASAAM